ncbi:MAG: hypothetical protein WCJ29_01420 [bacterium]
MNYDEKYWAYTVTLSFERLSLLLKGVLPTEPFPEAVHRNLQDFFRIALEAFQGSEKLDLKQRPLIKLMIWNATNHISGIGPGHDAAMIEFLERSRVLASDLPSLTSIPPEKRTLAEAVSSVLEDLSKTGESQAAAEHHIRSLR